MAHEEMIAVRDYPNGQGILMIIFSRARRSSAYRAGLFGIAMGLYRKSGIDAKLSPKLWDKLKSAAFAPMMPDESNAIFKERGAKGRETMRAAHAKVDLPKLSFLP